MFTIGISSPRHHEELVADIMVDSAGVATQVAELFRGDGAIQITIFTQ